MSWIVASLSGAIADLLGAVSGVTGIRNAPDYPAEQINNSPSAMAYGSSGGVMDSNPLENRSEHNIQIAVVTPLTDLVQASLLMLPFYELVMSALVTYLNGRTSTNFSIYRQVSYTYGTIEWPTGQNVFGWVFTVEGVLIQNTL